MASRTLISDPIVQCPKCKLVHSLAGFLGLPQCTSGKSFMDSGNPDTCLFLRNCHCGTTISVELPQFKE